MNILIVGYGKMGHVIEQVLRQRNHTIAAIIDKDDPWDKVDNKSVDCAICFTNPDSAMETIDNCFKRNIPVVMGTTGWYDNIEKVRQRVTDEGQSFLYAANFSIGIYILRKMNTWLAKLMNHYPQYEPSITEVHHTHKLDAPSGTAIVLASELIEVSNKKKTWKLNESTADSELKVTALRLGEEFGTHIVDYESENDIIEIAHKAKNRNSLAFGAVLSAEFLQHRKGFYTMDDLMREV